jgi:GR25 family glycosyltransferase involved in LPS biosynthesis
MYLWGTHAYLINNKNAKKIYNKLLNMDLAIDNKFKKLIDDKELNGLTIYPILVDQERHEYESSIR